MRDFGSASIVTAIVVALVLLALLVWWLMRRAARGTPQMMGSAVAVLGGGRSLGSVLQALLVDEDITRVVVVSNDPLVELDQLERGRARVSVHAGDPARSSVLRDAGLDHVGRIMVLGNGALSESVVTQRSLVAHTFDDKTRHVVAEVVRPEAAAALADVSGDAVRALSSDAVTATLLHQACQTALASTVFDAMLRSPGLALWRLDGTPREFWRLVTQDDRVAPIGVVSPAGVAQLVPGPTTLVTASHQALVMGERSGDLTEREGGGEAGFADHGQLEPQTLDAPQHVTIVGWSGAALVLLRRLLASLPTDSLVEVRVDDTTDPLALPYDELRTERVRLLVTPCASGSLADDLDYSCDVILVISHADTPQADEAAVQTAAAVAAGQSKVGAGVRLVLQLFDAALDARKVPAGCELIETRPTMAALMVSAAQSAPMAAALQHLFSDTGPSVIRRNASEVVGTAEGPFGAAVDRCARSGDVALGVVTDNEVTVNPARSTKFRFGPDDDIVVLTNRSYGLHPSAVDQLRARIESDGQADVDSDAMWTAIHEAAPVEPTRRGTKTRVRLTADQALASGDLTALDVTVDLTGPEPVVTRDLAADEAVLTLLDPDTELEWPSWPTP